MKKENQLILYEVIKDLYHALHTHTELDLDGEYDNERDKFVEDLLVKNISKLDLIFKQEISGGEQ